MGSNSRHIHILVRTITVMLGLLMSGCSMFYGPPKDLPNVLAPTEYVLTNVHIVDVKSGRLLRDQYIHINNEHIIATGNHLQQQHKDMTIIDGHGGFVTPGLMDMHVHLYDRKDLVANLVNGVTTVRNLMGFPMHLRWREELKQKQWLGATPVVSSPILNGAEHSHLLQEVVTDAKSAQHIVRQYKIEGYDLLKFYGYLAPDVYDAMMTTAIEINMPVAKHGPYSPGDDPYRWLEHVQSLEHVEDIFQGPLSFEFDEQKLQDYITNISASKPYITPTLTAYDHLTQLSEHKQEFVNGIPMQQHNPFFRWLKQTFRVNRWLEADEATIAWNKKVMNWLMHTTHTLHEAGIPLLVGSDAGVMFTIAGESTHREMQLMQAAGIPASEVLKSATWHPAVAMDLQQQLGSVGPGKVADLIVLSENPLTDIKAMQFPNAVIKQGQYLPKTTLMELQERLNTPSSFMTGIAHLMEYLTD